MPQMLYSSILKPLIQRQSRKMKLSITSITGKGGEVGGFERNLRKSFPSKRVTKYYQRLFEVSLLLIGCSPEANPINPYQRLEKKIKLPVHLPRENLSILYQLLLHASVIFNRTHRLRKQRRLLISREDVVNALALLRPIAFPQSMLLPSSRKFYLELLTTVGKEKEVTRQEISNLLQYHPQKVWRHILSLIEAGYIIITRKGTRGICYYRIVQP